MLSYIKDLFRRLFKGKARVVEPVDVPRILRLTSASQEHIFIALERGHWTHTRNPSQLREGDTVYIVPNSGELKNGWDLCIKAIAAGKGMEVPPEYWTEELEGKKYVKMIPLRDMLEMRFDQLPTAVREANACKTGIRYISGYKPTKKKK